MEVIAAGAAYALNNWSPQKALAKLGLASLLAGNLNFTADLGPKLSSEASILQPGDANFANLASRWREWHAPSIAAVVQAATEDDVQQTVRLLGLLPRGQFCLLQSYRCYMPMSTAYHSLQDLGATVQRKRWQPPRALSRSIFEN